MDLEKLKNYLLKKCANDLVVFVTPDYKRGLLLNNFFPHFLLVSGYSPQNLEALRASGLQIVTTQSLLPNSKNSKIYQNSGKILECKEVINYIKKLGFQNTHIVTFKGSSKVEFICKKNNWNILNIDNKTTAQLENKSRFSKVFKDCLPLLLPSYEGVFGNLTSVKIDELLKASDSGKLAVQFSVGFAGSSTSFLSKKEVLNFQAKNAKKTVKVSPMLSGPTLTLNGCVHNSQIFISHPFLQKTGLKGLTHFEGGSCGVNFDCLNVSENGIKITREVLDKTVQIAKECAKSAIDSGLNGFFGMDFIVSKNGIFPLEINPRLTANIHPFSANQINNSQIPFIIFHILEFMKIYLSVPDSDKFWKKKYKGQTTILRNLGKSDKPVAKLYKTKPASNAETFIDFLNGSHSENTIAFDDSAVIPPNFEYAEAWEK